MENEDNSELYWLRIIRSYRIKYIKLMVEVWNSLLFKKTLLFH